MTRPTDAYRKANPLGGPATVFRAIAGRLEAGEDYYAVLEDYGLVHSETPAIPDGMVLVPMGWVVMRNDGKIETEINGNVGLTNERAVTLYVYAERGRALANGFTEEMVEAALQAALDVADKHGGHVLDVRPPWHEDDKRMVRAMLAAAHSPTVNEEKQR